MLSAFPAYIKKWFAVIVTAGMTGTLLLTGCQGNVSAGQNREFQTFTKEVFCRETASNTISLHYTLKNPEKYGIDEIPVTFGCFPTEEGEILASVENLQQAMEQFDKKKLSVKNQLTYDVLDYYLERSEEGAKYVLYEEPLGLVSGIQTQLPVLLSEYPFYSKEDVDTYLALMKTTPEYFQSLIAFEQKKSEAGLFMADYAAEQVINQCEAFMKMGESNYLISTFVERIEQVKGLSEKEKSNYIQKNALMLNNYVLPAYNRLQAAMQKLMGTGSNEKGLCYLPEGKAYYEQVVKDAVGTERSVEELRELTRQQIVADLEAMEEVLGIDAGDSPGSGGQSGTAGNTDTGQSSEYKDNSDAERDGEEGTEEETDTSQALETLGEVKVSWEAAAIVDNLTGEMTIDQTAEAEQEWRGSSSLTERGISAANPVTILNTLEEKITGAFPAPPETAVSVKYVPEAMEEHLSPAFYMIPAIDNFEDNVIYVNQAHMGNTLTLFTTLAHEGYPGHLYQTVYYAAMEPDPLRSIFNFGGYVEGWATYAEMCSYSLAPLTKEQAVLLQKNSSIILGLYTLADIGIHYDGWSRMDTFSFFSNYGIQDVDTTNRIYDLIIGSPGNYLKYYIGYVEFLELKKEWAAEKGNNFSQKEFHEAVLSVGPAPFELVEEYMWKICE